MKTRFTVILLLFSFLTCTLLGCSGPDAPITIKAVFSLNSEDTLSYDNGNSTRDFDKIASESGKYTLTFEKSFDNFREATKYLSGYRINHDIDVFDFVKIETNDNVQSFELVTSAPASEDELSSKSNLSLVLTVEFSNKITDSNGQKTADGKVVKFNLNSFSNGQYIQAVSEIPQKKTSSVAAYVFCITFLVFCVVALIYRRMQRGAFKSRDANKNVHT